MTFNPGTDLDETDWRILRELQKDARVSFAELGRTVNLSRPAVAERMHRLEEFGVITGYRADVDLARLGYGITAFVRVKAQGTNVAALADLIKAAPEVLECHRSIGEDSFILKVVASSLQHLESVLDGFASHGQVTTSLILSSVLTKRVVTQGFDGLKA